MTLTYKRQTRTGKSERRARIAVSARAMKVGRSLGYSLWNRLSNGRVLKIAIQKHLASICGSQQVQRNPPRLRGANLHNVFQPTNCYNRKVPKGTLFLHITRNGSGHADVMRILLLIRSSQRRIKFGRALRQRSIRRRDGGIISSGCHKPSAAAPVSVLDGRTDRQARSSS